MASKADNDSNTAKNWELNIYELNRIPHEIIYDETEIAVSPNILQNELMCPICLEILKTTMTTKECLHRFCHDCIITALRAGNKECPTCRKKLVSKRSLRPDPNFDGIIAKIYPNREEYDALHEKVLEKLNKNKKFLTGINNGTNQKTATAVRQSKKATAQVSSHEPISSNGNAVTASTSDETSMDVQVPAHAEPVSNSVSTSKPHDSVSRGNKRANHDRTQNHSDESDMESRTSTEQSSSLQMANDLDEIELILKPHPHKEFSMNSNRFLKTTSNATVNHLSKYLWTRLCVDAASSTGLETSSAVSASASGSTENDFQIFFSSNETKPGSFHLLNHNFTLEQVIDKYWKQNRPLELFYLLKSHVQQSGTAANSNHTNINGVNENATSSSSISSNSSTSSITSSCNGMANAKLH